MRISILLFLLLSLAAAQPARAQARLVQQGARDTFRTMPGEAVFVHLNSSLLFAGETLYYSLYCREQGTGQPSSISKIAYVALLDRDRQPVFHHKVRLEQGLGQGDFFVPADIPTGSYKLIAYSQWMKNGNGAPIFQADVVLINPYVPVPDTYLPVSLPDSIRSDSLSVAGPPVSQGTRRMMGQPGEQQLKLTLSGTTFGTRERVSLKLEPQQPEAIPGRYSLSVRRISDFPHPDLPKADYVGGITPAAGGIAGTEPPHIVLPELRGELLTGRVLDRSGERPVPNIPLALSMPGDAFLFSIARTNEDGRYYFNLDREYENGQGILQVIADSAQAYTLVPDPQELAFPSSLEYYSFTLDAAFEHAIRTRSIENQIENAYASVKADTLLGATGALPFYRNLEEVYQLDDFTRFNTIEETLVEIVDNVWLSRDANGDLMFQVRPKDGYLDGIGMPPMVFMDGLFIQNHEDITGFPARQIKTVSFSQGRYQLGANVFQGILAFETIAADFDESFYREFLKRIALFKPQPGKAYFFQRYEAGNRKERVPDFRRQLYWQPVVRIVPEGRTLDWYTSDVKGTFEVRVEGYTANGAAVSLRAQFHVE